MYIYTIIKYYTTLLCNPIIFVKPWFYVVIIKYGHLIFLLLLMIYNIFTIHYTGSSNEINCTLVTSLDYLPNYLKFNMFFNINDFLYNQIEYDVLDASLNEIDYSIIENDKQKTTTYIRWMRWQDLPGLLEEEEIVWHNNFALFMQTGQGNLTYDIEKCIMKYILGYGGLTQYMPVKYTSWRYLEAKYIKNILIELRDSGISKNRWQLLLKCTQNRLYSSRKTSYLFRSYDTYMCWFYTYEAYRAQCWVHVFEKRYVWAIHQFYLKKPVVICLFFLTKSLTGAGIIYILFNYVNF